MSIIYRYKCSVEGVVVYETRNQTDPPPSVCVNEGAVIVSGSLAIYDRPEGLQYVNVEPTGVIDFNGCTIVDLSHTALNDVGNHTHAEIDSHISAASIHRSINDMGTGATDLWSASKINTELAGKSSTSHTHTAANVTNFQATVSANSDVSANTTHRGQTNNPHGVTKAQVGLSNVQDLKVNLSASVDPSTANDSTAGYTVGSQWINITTDKVFQCVDSTSAAAVWKRLDIFDHNDLSNVGTTSHAQIDTHISDTTKHRVINDAGTDATQLWSASKINTELAGKASTSHTHTAANVTNFQATVSANSDVSANSAHRADTTTNPHAVTKAQVGLSNVPNLKQNLAATVGPSAATDDVLAGYSVGSRWFDTAADKEYVCLDSTQGASVWKETTVAAVSTASALTTTGASVAVSAAAPPSTGQALIASSATTAAWQNLSALTWRGVWSSGTTYAINDTTSSGGATWICVASHTNQIPPNATYWNQVADGFHWKGAWSGATNYVGNDVVTQSGVSYICILDHTNNTPPNTTYWNVFTQTAPSGSTTQVQYNNAGALAGTANLTIDTSDNYAIVGDGSGTAPSAPVAGAKLFARFRAGRRMLAQVGPSGMDYSFQPGIFSQKVAWWTAQGNATTVSLINFGNSITGTATTRNVATTNLFTSIRRIGYVSQTGSGSSAGTRHAAQQFFMSASPVMGGFFYVARFGTSSASTVATQRTFVGLIASTAVLSNADPSTQLNILGFACDSADSSFSFIHNDGSGTATKDALTGTFPARNLSVSMFEARIFCPLNYTTVYYSLEVLGGGSLYEGSTSTNVPAVNTLLSPQIWTNNGSTNLPCGIDVVSQYIETDN